MSLNKEHDLMKTSFLEAKDIINKIFEYLSAPEYYFIKHMTFDELVVALYRLLGLYEGVYGDNPPHIEYIVDTFDGTATSDDILLGKIAYSKGQRIEGNIVSFPGHTYMPTTVDIVIPEKHYLAEDQIIKGDEDLLPENIRYKKNLFDVNGTFTEDADITPDDVLENKIGYAQGEQVVGRVPKHDIGDVILDEEHAEQNIERGYYEPACVRIQTQEKYAHPGIHELIIEPDDDHVLSRVFVDGDEDLIPKNIRKDVIIFDVVGELEEFTKYNIIYVINVLKQYAYQQQVEYGEQFSIIGTQPVLDDYEFKGWSPDPNAETVVYQPGQLVTTNLADKGGAYILYAVLEEMNLADITLDITYQNGGKLHDGQEIATVVVHGGNLSTGYSNVQRDLQCDNAIFISKFANETQNSYDNQLKFTEIGLYPVIVIHKRKDKQVQATGVIKVAGENGGMNGEGTMTFETNPTVSYFDSGWISTDIIKGCWIKGYTYNYKSGGGHGSQYDELAVFGKTSSGKMILLYDFGNTANLKKEINIGSITGSDIYNGGTYKLSVGDFELTNNNLSTTQWNITDSFTKNDDIRQLRFFASSDHGQGCFDSAHIDYDIQYEFDMDLWEEDKKRGDVHNHSYTYRITTPATCGAKGLKTGTCTCGQTVTEPIPMTGKHTWNNGTITTQATCATAGVKTITCTVCGQTKTENIAATGNHSWNAGVVTKEPTTTATGVKTYTCNTCGKTKTETIPKLTPEASVDLSQDRDFSGKWGWYTIRNNNAQKELYKRIYNAHMNNGKEATVKYTNFTTGATQTCNSLFNGSGTYNGYLYVPVDDLNISNIDDVWYVNGIIEQDCPELIWKWQSSNPAVCHRTSTGLVADLCLCHYSVSDKNSKKIKIESTFNEICSLVKTHYNITYVENTFTNNNTYYNELQKKQIAKVIHDYLEVHNHYGNVNEPEKNQNVYAAMSKGDWHPVCASYSQAFKYCCERWGISCICIIGHAYNGSDGNHAWNMVSYKQQNPGALANNNAAWQEVDCTWDDMSTYNKLNEYASYGISAAMMTNACRWEHFNVTTSEINSGVTTKDYYFDGAQIYFPGGKESGRRKDIYGSSDDSDGLPDIGVYTTHPVGTCSSNKYDGSNGQVLYKGF